MKIAFFITGLGMGGAENLVVNLADYYHDNGHKVIIIYAYGNCTVKPKSSMVKLYPLNIKSYFDILSASCKFKHIIDEFSPDVVHSHMYHANIFSRFLRLFTNIKYLINTAHSVNEGGKWRMLAYRFTHFLTDKMTNVSKEASLAFVEKKAVRSNDILSIENGIDTNRFVFCEESRQEIRSQLRVNENTKIILAIGSLRKAKDYPNLLYAIHILSKKRMDFKLFIIGSGSLLEDLKLLSSKLEIDDVVEFLGIKNDVEKYLSASDIFVLSSSFEGFGLVVAEAMSCERPVVATDCGGVREVVGDCGLLIEPGNFKLLSHAIEKVMDFSIDEMDCIGKCSRERVLNNFSLELTAKKYMDLYLGSDLIS